MSLFFVLIILVLGYTAVQHIPAEKVILKKSSNWESYVLLAAKGLLISCYSVFGSFIVFIFFWIILNFISLLMHLFCCSTVHLGSALVNILNKSFFELKIYEIIIIMVAFIIAREIGENEKKNIDWLKKMREIDNLVELLLEASDRQMSVKISLKSKKVYIGLIKSEQFKKADLENIKIIPFLSGYRNSEDLSIKFNCHYVEFYNKILLLDRIDDADLENFSCVIRINEIESVSFYNPKYQLDFENIKNTKKIAP